MDRKSGGQKVWSYFSHGGSRTGREESILQSRILESSVENGQVVAVWEKCC